MKSLLQDLWTTLPDSFAKPSAGILFLFVLILIWSLPLNKIYEEKPIFWKDLRIWSTLLIGIQFFIYAIF